MEELFKPVTTKGLVAAFTIVPVPCGKPDGPYSICQFVAPPVVQLIVTELALVLVTFKFEGCGQVGCSWMSKSSIARAELKANTVFL